MRQATVAKFEPHDRALKPDEIGWMYQYMERMKRRNPHLVFLSRQALDIFIALDTLAGGSDYVQPSSHCLRPADPYESLPSPV